jgi:hypothetical protein
MFFNTKDPRVREDFQLNWQLGIDQPRLNDSTAVRPPTEMMQSKIKSCPCLQVHCDWPSLSNGQYLADHSYTLPVPLLIVMISRR